MDHRTKIAAAWWTNALRETYPGRAHADHEIDDWKNDGRSTPGGSEAPVLEAPALIEQKLEAFEAALAREIGLMLTDDLTHVLAVHQRWAAPQFSKAAAASGIENIQERLPNGAVMRIFPNTVMTHAGPHAQVEILWSNNSSLECCEYAQSGVAD